MQTTKLDPKTPLHVVALPYPGRGHVNPMMNICKLLASKQPSILITFVVTQEWHAFIESDSKPENIRFATLPNVIPSEIVRAKDFIGFMEAVSTKMREPFEKVLDEMETRVRVLIADSYVVWAVRVGNERNIPVASLWTMSASVFTTFFHFELIKENGHFPVDVSIRGDEVIDYIPGISTTTIADLPTIFHENGQKLLNVAIEAVSSTHKAQYLLSTSFYELEPHAYDTLRLKFSAPIYPIGPSIPHFDLTKLAHAKNDLEYMNWLDSQPKDSVLYISLGSFLSVSNAQMDEIVAGMKGSGVRFMWVARGDASRIKDGVGDKGLVVAWCDQLRVLCHASIGGFWSHCGWNSTQEAVFGGLPVLTCPIFWDQIPNGKQIVDDWKIGYRVIKKGGELVSRDEIGELVKRFMDVESNEGKKMRKRARQLQETCQGAIAKGGSSDSNLDAFINDLTQC